MEDHLFITILVICALNKYADNYKAEWRLLVKKASNFVLKKGVSPDTLKELKTVLEAKI